MMKKASKQSGFSLVEMMIVVAILGLISAVAVPKFKHYQARAKMTEAKLLLSSLYMAEATAFGEFGIYVGCLRYIGFDPHDKIASRHYAIGFPVGISAREAIANAEALKNGLQDDPNNCPDSSTPVDGSTNVAAADANTATWYPAGKGIGSQIASTLAVMLGSPAGVAHPTCDKSTMNAQPGTCVGTQADESQRTFQAMAIGYISSDNLTPATASSLTINQDKIVKVVVDGF
jgi:prepilin-type N-terminal cleavage/methylation domain-containing protein